MNRSSLALNFAWSALICLAACRAPVEANDDRASSLEADFGRGTVLITADDGQQYEFDVWLAESAAQQRRGLMFVREMPPMTGMLFVYDKDDYRSMWMKNTYISLDMVFARQDGRISSVIHETQPRSLASQASSEPVTYVLELNAGTARRLQIGNRSRLEWTADDDD